MTHVPTIGSNVTGGLPTCSLLRVDLDVRRLSGTQRTATAATAAQRGLIHFIAVLLDNNAAGDRPVAGQMP